ILTMIPSTGWIARGKGFDGCAKLFDGWSGLMEEYINLRDLFRRHIRCIKPKVLATKNGECIGGFANLEKALSCCVKFLEEVCEKIGAGYLV
ncbi:MAG: hypothetical protein IKE05_00400, partial [Clostridia bacterium]|nr:hypothetical protein [Clostridia bacterium]